MPTGPATASVVKRPKYVFGIGIIDPDSLIFKSLPLPGARLRRRAELLQRDGLHATRRVVAHAVPPQQAVAQYCTGLQLQRAAACRQLCRVQRIQPAWVPAGRVLGSSQVSLWQLSFWTYQPCVYVTPKQVYIDTMPR